MTWTTLAEYREQYNAAKTPGDRIRAFYNLPADVKRGRRVLYGGRPGVITAVGGGSGMDLCIRLDGETSSNRYHPTWNITFPPIGDPA